MYHVLKFEHTVTKENTGPTFEGMLVDLLENTPDFFTFM